MTMIAITSPALPNDDNDATPPFPLAVTLFCMPAGVGFLKLFNLSGNCLALL